MRTQPAKGLRQFAAQRPPADDGEALRQGRHLEDRRARAIAGLIEACNVWRPRTSAGGDQRFLEMQPCVADEEGVRTNKSGGTEKNVDPARGEFMNRMVLRNSHADSAHASHYLAKF